MRRYATDLSFSEEGDFIIDDSGDFAMSKNDECLREDIAIRAKTQAGDWYHFPLLGASLESLVGNKNTQSIADRGRRLLLRSLIYDGLLTSNELRITSFPTRNTILYKVDVSKINLPILLSLELDLGVHIV